MEEILNIYSIAKFIVDLNNKKLLGTKVHLHIYSTQLDKILNLVLMQPLLFAQLNNIALSIHGTLSYPQINSLALFLTNAHKINKLPAWLNYIPKLTIHNFNDFSLFTQTLPKLLQLNSLPMTFVLNLSNNKLTNHKLIKTCKILVNNIAKNPVIQQLQIYLTGNLISTPGMIGLTTYLEKLHKITTPPSFVKLCLKNNNINDKGAMILSAYLAKITLLNIMPSYLKISIQHNNLKPIGAKHITNTLKYMYLNANESHEYNILFDNNPIKHIGALYILDTFLHLKKLNIFNFDFALNFANNCIEDHGMKILSNKITELATLNCFENQLLINLEKNNISSLGLEYLVNNLYQISILRKIPAHLSINLSCNNIKSDGIRILANGLQLMFANNNLPKILSINLASNFISHHSINRAVKLLKRISIWPQKLTICLSNNQLDDAGFISLTRILYYLNTSGPVPIEFNLDISDNNLKEVSAYSLATALKKLNINNKIPSHFYINLANNNINDLGAKYIAQAITGDETSHIIPKGFSLNLSNNNISSIGSSYFAAFIKNTLQLPKSFCLNLNNNNIGIYGILCLLQAISKAKYKLNYWEIHLCNNNKHYIHEKTELLVTRTLWYIVENRKISRGVLLNIAIENNFSETLCNSISNILKYVLKQKNSRESLDLLIQDKKGSLTYMYQHSITRMNAHITQEKLFALMMAFSPKFCHKTLIGSILTKEIVQEKIKPFIIKKTFL